MTLEAGSIIEGTVVNITNFGAFVEIDGKTGLVHISEVSDTYVKNIRDHLKEKDKVRVKVISIDENGKISLSIKQAAPPE
ncbi:MAG TPA: S1 RNA-binding domain-containing protein, partial [Clostridiaceae bacterium]